MESVAHIQKKTHDDHRPRGHVFIAPHQWLFGTANSLVTLKRLVAKKFAEAGKDDDVVPERQQTRSMPRSVEPGLQRSNLSGLTGSVDSGETYDFHLAAHGKRRVQKTVRL